MLRVSITYKTRVRIAFFCGQFRSMTKGDTIRKSGNLEQFCTSVSFYDMNCGMRSPGEAQ